MVSFKKESKTSARLEFDNEGVEELLVILSKALNDSIGFIEICDKKILKITKNEYQSTLSISNDNSITIELDTDEIEYAVERFNRCSKEKAFYPAEFCELKYKKSDISVYGMYID